MAAVTQRGSSPIAKTADEVAAAAQRLFQAIRDGRLRQGLEQAQGLEQFPAKDVDYCVDHGFPFWVKWVCNKFKADPIVDVQLGKVFADSEGRPTVHFRLVLKDGEILQGDLPFIRNRRPRFGSWIGLQALDWHLKKSEQGK